MKKIKRNLLIPFFIILGLIVVLGVILWNEDFMELFKPDRNVLTRVKDYPKIINSNLDNERDRLVITSEQDFQNFVNKNFENPAEIPLPNINFSNQKLVVAITENNQTSGYGVKIRTVKKELDKDIYIVNTVYTKPGESCLELDTTKNTVIDMVMIPNNNFEIKFNRETKEVECK